VTATLTKFRITYLPFPNSDLEASDVVLFAKDEADARAVFERTHSNMVFKKATAEP